MRCYDLVLYHLNKVEFPKTAKWHRHSATLLLYKNNTRIQPVGNKFHFHTYRVSTKAEQPVPASSEPFCELTNFETLSFTPVHPVFWVFQAPCPGPWQLQSEESVQPLPPEALVAAAQPQSTESSVGTVLPNKNSGQNRSPNFVDPEFPDVLHPCHWLPHHLWPPVKVNFHHQHWATLHH